MSNNLEYARRLYDSVTSWYDSADSKAQVVLGIDTVFIAFLTSTIFSQPDELKEICTAFNWITWLTLILMFLSLGVSIGATIVCLYSRMYSSKEVQQIVKKVELQSKDYNKYPPNIIMWFFQFIEGLDENKFYQTLKSAEEEFELKVLAKDIYVLSKNVREKHQAVNIAFVSTAFSLILFVIAATSYMYSVV